MTVMVRTLTLVAIFLTPTTSAFLFQYKPVEGLANIAEQVGSSTKLDINLSVGQNMKADKLSLSGLAVELSDAPSTSKKRVLLPGTDGPNARVSSGARQLKVLDMPGYVTLEGTKAVQLQDACWEVVWREEQPGGHLVCGFNVPNEASRNQATLPAGSLFLSIPLWTQEGLAAEQLRKFEVEDLGRKHMQKRDEEVGKMQSTGNFLEKAWHYRNALEAVEKYSLSAPSSVQHIPNGGDAIPMPGGYVMANKGMAWTKKGPQKMQLGEFTLRRPTDSESAALGI